MVHSDCESDSSCMVLLTNHRIPSGQTSLCFLQFVKLYCPSNLIPFQSGFFSKRNSAHASHTTHRPSRTSRAIGSDAKIAILSWVETFPSGRCVSWLLYMPWRLSLMTFCSTLVNFFLVLRKSWLPSSLMRWRLGCLYFCVRKQY